ncbi:type IV pilin protein [Carnobacterium gallinarum]|uniref:type IV pilin protein n=1 Tax=Carnobacterium gallinarum TaxID=2749 RepID=UPI00055268A2|nr:type II secretion system protein [Carnobacterium gallinarum]
MTEVLVLREENKVSRMLKDERGMTLVELLATVVILAIIAAIGVTAIGRVIQNTREDAGVANVQQAMNAAKLYQSTESKATGGKFFTLKEILDGGYLEAAKGTWETPDTVVFTVETDGSLTLAVPANQLTAGNKKSQPIAAGTTNDDILSLTRADLWTPPANP